MKEKFICDVNHVHEDIVEQMKKSLPDDILLNDLTEFFKIFADNTRLKILWLLDRNELCVCDIACLLNTTKSAVSHQLRILRNANLVRFRKSGKEVYYKLSDDHIAQIFETAICHVTHC